MMMMALLRQADLVLEAEHLGAVFAHLAVHIVQAGENIVKTVLKYLQHQRMVVEIAGRSEEHTSELQSLMRSSYAVFCLKNKNRDQNSTRIGDGTITQQH